LACVSATLARASFGSSCSNRNGRFRFREERRGRAMQTPSAAGVGWSMEATGRREGSGGGAGRRRIRMALPRTEPVIVSTTSTDCAVKKAAWRSMTPQPAYGIVTCVVTWRQVAMKRRSSVVSTFTSGRGSPPGMARNAAVWRPLLILRARSLTAGSNSPISTTRTSIPSSPRHLNGAPNEEPPLGRPCRHESSMSRINSSYRLR
jgi:hypothetical protein